MEPSPSRRRFLRALAPLLALVAACGGPSGPVNTASKGGEADASAPRPTAAPEDGAVVPIASDDAVWGSRLAPVTIVVFSDLECPFCARLDATLDQLRDAYGPDDLRIVFKNNPLRFHRHARLAAEVGQGVLALGGPDAFWRYQAATSRGMRAMSEETIRAWAIDAGADARALDEGLASKRWAAKVDRDLETAARVGANGTPNSFVNGVLVGGAQPFAAFQEIIDAELERATELVAVGVPRDAIYTRLAASNFVPPADREEPGARARPVADTSTVHRIPIGSAPARGPATALVTIVVFSDFECPFCKRAEDTLERVVGAYGDKVRVVWRDRPLPFHQRAMPAAELARAARAQKGDAGFWAVHDLLFASQSDLGREALERIAREAKLDVKKAMAALDKRTFQQAIEADVALGDDFEINGTPQSFINGRRLVGAQPFEAFEAIIDAEILKAEALVRAGTPPARVYDALVKDGKGPVEPEQRAMAAPSKDAPFRGAASAKLVIQQVSDFECPFCQRVEPTLDALLAAYPGKLKIVWRDNPLPMHPHAPLASEAAREAHAQKGNAGFEKMQRLLFANQGALGREDLERYAAEIGLDVPRFVKALDERTHKAAVDADAQATADAGVSGTPSFFIGPYFLSGAQPLQKFKRLVDRALAAPGEARK